MIIRVWTNGESWDFEKAEKVELLESAGVEGKREDDRVVVTEYKEE